MELSSKSKRRKWHEEGCLVSEFCLTVCLKVPLNAICLQPVPAPSQCGQNFSAPAENRNSQSTTAETAPLSNLTAELHHRELGDQNNCNIQTLLHHHISLELTFAPLFMKMVMKPHLLKVSVLFYLTLNKGESSHAKDKPKQKKPRTLHSQSLDTVCYFSLALPEPLQAFLTDTVKIPRRKKLVGLTEGVLHSPE